jgi:hypothetical protein
MTVNFTPELEKSLNRLITVGSSQQIKSEELRLIPYMLATYPDINATLPTIRKILKIYYGASGSSGKADPLNKLNVLFPRGDETNVPKLRPMATLIICLEYAKVFAPDMAELFDQKLEMHESGKYYTTESMIRMIRALYGFPDGWDLFTYINDFTFDIDRDLS